ncbi:MAG: hypothetical protein DDT21_02447 [Syntrophomonadaceae bacterium]|nr:hypothetical protein [Bacillota bacterium]
MTGGKIVRAPKRIKPWLLLQSCGKKRTWRDKHSKTEDHKFNKN